MILFLCLLFIFEGFDSKIVKTSYGALRGATIIFENGNDKYSFKSVPFAQPPLGELRFKLPQKPKTWKNVLNATEYSAACVADNKNSRFAPKSVSEDCLYVNIFTSEKCLKTSCSVIIYYHGGSFLREGATAFPDQFIFERYVDQDIVFVIPAFRLGVFGQLYFGPSENLSENLLLFDAAHGLQFIHKEISNFGGDPNRVTIMGHSTGGLLVNALGFSKLIDPEKDLFQQMIVLSAPGEFGFSKLAIESSFELARRLNCTSQVKNYSKLNILNVSSCLRQIDALKILEVQTDMGNIDSSLFRSIIRGPPFMKIGEKTLEFQKNVPPRNILYGTSEYEFIDRSLGRKPAAGILLDFENPKKVVSHYLDILSKHEDWLGMDSDNVFVSARTYCKAMVKVGRSVYLFETRQKPKSTHITDMQYFIGIHRENERTKDMDILDSFYSAFLVNFTKKGVPSPEWPKLDPKKMNYLELKYDSVNNERPRMLENYHEKEMNVWFGEMTDYDRNVTETKKQMSNGISKELNAENHVPETEKNSIFSQWWFYLICFVLVALLFVATVYSKRNIGINEETPLLR